MAKGGIIMDVTTPEEARIAEEAGACAVMALERVPADIRREGGVARMTDPKVEYIESSFTCQWSIQLLLLNVTELGFWYI